VAINEPQVHRLWEAVRLTSHEIVWEQDPTGVITFVADGSARLIDLGPADLVGRSVFSIIHPDDVAACEAILAGCRADRRGWDEVQARILTSDGTAVWVGTSGVANHGEDGQLLGFTATVRKLDADDAKNAQAAITRGRIEQVLADRALTTVWQPIFSLADGGIVAVEALSRFPSEEHGPPDRWFADAFGVGLGVELETLAVECALDTASQFPEEVHISVNVSPTTVAHGRLAAVIAAGPIPARRIIIELTEHVSIENYERVARGLDGLRREGARLAVDDAGAGFASFRHILRLRPDIIKLDQSITRGIPSDRGRRALASALVMFATQMGSMTVTAEGVETEDELMTVSTLGLDAAQGFHMARPLPSSDVDWAVTLPDSTDLDELSRQDQPRSSVG
jgi:PAS domain S-box-containing protein